MSKIYEWTYGEVTLVRVIDGDTAVFRLQREYVQDIDFGFYIYDSVRLVKATEVIFRLDGVNTPEIVGEQKARGLEVKALVEGLLAAGPIKVRSLKPDKYGGRYIAQVWVQQPDGSELYLNQHLIDIGAAKPYSGAGVKPV